MQKKEWMTAVIAIAVIAIGLFAFGRFSAVQAAEKEVAERTNIFTYMGIGDGPYTEEVYEGEDESIRHVYRGSEGYVLEVTTNGYADELTLWVGVGNDGKVKSVMPRNLAETPGLGGKAQKDTDFLFQFLDTEGEATIGEGVEAITGATVTSKAVARAVNSAAGYVTGADVTSGATEWSE